MAGLGLGLGLGVGRRPRGDGGAAYLPSDEGDLAYWLGAQGLASLAVGAGVDSWASLIGNPSPEIEPAASQIDPARRPQVVTGRDPAKPSRRGAEGDGVDDLLTLPELARRDCTVVLAAVASVQPTNARPIVTQYSAAGDQAAIVVELRAADWYVSTSTGNVIGGYSDHTAVSVYAVSVTAAGQVELYVNGIPEGSGTVPVPLGDINSANHLFAYRPGDNHFAGTVFDLLVYHRALDAEAVARVSGYLRG